MSVASIVVMIAIVSGSVVAAETVKIAKAFSGAAVVRPATVCSITLCFIVGCFDKGK